MHRSTWSLQPRSNYPYCSFQHCNGLSLLTPEGEALLSQQLTCPFLSANVRSFFIFCHMGFIFFALQRKSCCAVWRLPCLCLLSRKVFPWNSWVYKFSKKQGQRLWLGCDVLTLFMYVWTQTADGLIKLELHSSNKAHIIINLLS